MFIYVYLYLFMLLVFLLLIWCIEYNSSGYEYFRFCFRSRSPISFRSSCMASTDLMYSRQDLPLCLILHPMAPSPVLAHESLNKPIYSMSGLPASKVEMWDAHPGRVSSMPNTTNPLFSRAPYYISICARRLYKPRTKRYHCLSWARPRDTVGGERHPKVIGRTDKED